MLMFQDVMNEAYKEFVDVAAKLTGKAVKSAATIAFLVTVMPPMLVIGCVGTLTIFACETGGKVVEIVRGTRVQRKRRKK